MSLESITNRGEFFSNHYVDAVLAGDLGDLRSGWDDAEGRGDETARSRIKSGAREFFAARADANEAGPSTADDALRRLHDVVLGRLGFEVNRTELEFKQNTEHLLHVPVVAKVETSTGLLLVAIEAGNAAGVDDLFDFDEQQLHTGVDQPGELRRAVRRSIDNRTVNSVADAVGEIFNTDEPPRYVLVLGGSIVLLAERAKWAEGRFLAVDLGLAFDRNDASAKGELETIAALFSDDGLVPVDGVSAIETFDDKSHKHAVGVSKELRNGIRESIEIIANEVIEQRDNRARERNQKLFTRTDVDARELTRQSLRYLYRLIVLLYAESRPELGIVPARDQDYVDGYSLDRLRELCLVELDDDHARNGRHFQESLDRLFELVNTGYHADEAEQQFVFEYLTEEELEEEERRSHELYLQFPGLDAELFSPEATSLINEVPLRNEALQQVLRKLVLAEGKKGNDTAGFISYAQLGINQLGAVYEGLMAYTGFYADTDLYEVAKGGDPGDGTWMLPVADADEYPDDVFVMSTDDVTGQRKRVLHEKGSFVFRLSGRDRQRSASYYTPEVLTKCVVKHALAELLGLDDYAPEHGSSGIVHAVDLLDLTICEPALGSGAFANEAINQLADEYLRRRQAELAEVLPPDRLALERQKVRAHFALHQTYGVDLNATAVELAEVSLWLNSMFPGLKAPSFGLQLRRGNSLVGCRRATWTVGQLDDRPWAATKAGSVRAPVDRPLFEPLSADEIHYFLLPGHGWASVADRSEASELRPEEAAALKRWRTQIRSAPTQADGMRLVKLAGAVESMWQAAMERVRVTQQSLRQPIDLYGLPTQQRPPSASGAVADTAISDDNSPLGRLRNLMDAWVGLWFWPLDSHVAPPKWEEWLEAAEMLVGSEPDLDLGGQLELFTEVSDLLETQERLVFERPNVAQVRERFPWLEVALESARNEGAWHWELEFSPVFYRGGFDLQVGNPPWVRPRWYEDSVLAERDPWWGIVRRPGATARRERRADALRYPDYQRRYLSELASSVGLVELLGSPLLRPVTSGIQINLYVIFMDTTWRQMSDSGVVGLLHPESHFVDPKAGALRRETYHRLRRHFMFYNELKLFEDVHNHTDYGVQIYGYQREPRFLAVSTVLHPDTIERSLHHDGEGDLPGQQLPEGGRDLRPHRERIIEINSLILNEWATLFDPPGTPAVEARLLRPVTTEELDALSVLAKQEGRLSGRQYHWTRGLEEDRAKAEGTIRWETATPQTWSDVVLQGPHFSVATPFSKQPNENCRSNRDYSSWNLEELPDRVIPRTNYQRTCSSEELLSRLDHWDGIPSSATWRHIHREMCDATTERTVKGALLPPGPVHVHACLTYGFVEPSDLIQWAALLASIPIDYLFKASGATHVAEHQLSRLPFPARNPLDSSISLRVLRLNCLTSEYSELWRQHFDLRWRSDRWSQPVVTGSSLADVDEEWTVLSPLRRDGERWLALVELDALMAIKLGISPRHLRAMYRTQFAVLRKYEHRMVFDSMGRKICGYHQSAGYRQSQLQGQAKVGDLPSVWKNLWSLYEQYEADPDSVDWMGLYTAPFTRADREAAMTLAYMEFQRRLDAGEYAS